MSPPKGSTGQQAQVPVGVVGSSTTTAPSGKPPQTPNIGSRQTGVTGTQSVPAQSASGTYASAVAMPRPIPAVQPDLQASLANFASTLDNISKRIAQIELRQSMPAQNLGIGPSGPVAGGLNTPAAPQGVVANEPPVGYTRLPNGKIIKMKRPKNRSLPERQAKNWYEKARDALIAFRRARNLNKGDPVAQNDQREHDKLVQDLERSKLYREYVESTSDPEEVVDWRKANPV